jgi:hypothetical protein
MCEPQHFRFATRYTVEGRDILLSLAITVLLSVTAFAQAEAERNKVDIVCARATQDAKGHEVTAGTETACREPSFSDTRDLYLTKRCLDKAKEMSEIANRTRDAVCVAKTAKEANAIGFEGFGKVNDIAQEEKDFAYYNLETARIELEKRNAYEKAKAKHKEDWVAGLYVAGLFGAAFLLWRWKKKRQAA